MLAAPIVAIVDPALIPGTLIMLATLVTLIVTVREREDIDLTGTGWALLGRVPGTVAGALLLAALPERGLAILLAGVVLLGVVLTSAGWVPAARRRNVVLAGATSGLLGTATSDRRPADGAGVAAQQRRAAARHHERLLPDRLGDVAGGVGVHRCGRRPHAADVRRADTRRAGRVTRCRATSTASSIRARLRLLAIAVSAIGATVLIVREVL